MTILLDTNILLDVLLDRKPFVSASETVYRACLLASANGYITPLTVANIYYLLRKVYGKDQALQYVRDLTASLDVLTMNRKTVLEALDSGFSDFEDALQHASAQNDTRIEAIITRNTRDFEQSKLPVFTPEEFLSRFF